MRQGARYSTYNVVNFESANARDEGRYFDGFNATCEVREDWSKPLGVIDEPLLATARTLADGAVRTRWLRGVKRRCLAAALRSETANPASARACSPAELFDEQSYTNNRYSGDSRHWTHGLDLRSENAVGTR